MRQAEKVDLGSDDWTMEIRPYASAFHFPIKELWEYRDLLFLFVRRDFKTMYKQTILGPAWILLSPLLTTGMFSLIFGRIAGISTDGTPAFLFYMASLTAKYRDLQVLVGFGIQLWMYASPIVYPLSQIPGKWRILLSLNPVAYIVECFRYGWLGSGIVSIPNLMIGLGIILLILFVGTVMFNKTQRNFMDTV